MKAGFRLVCRAVTKTNDQEAAALSVHEERLWKSCFKSLTNREQLPLRSSVAESVRPTAEDATQI